MQHELLTEDDDLLVLVLTFPDGVGETVAGLDLVELFEFRFKVWTSVCLILSSSASTDCNRLSVASKSSLKLTAS
jgi:hypothetical protein